MSADESVFPQEGLKGLAIVAAQRTAFKLHQELTGIKGSCITKADEFSPRVRYRCYDHSIGHTHQYNTEKSVAFYLWLAGLVILAGLIAAWISDWQGWLTC